MNFGRERHQRPTHVHQGLREERRQLAIRCFPANPCLKSLKVTDREHRPLGLSFILLLSIISKFSGLPGQVRFRQRINGAFHAYGQPGNNSKVRVADLRPESCWNDCLKEEKKELSDRARHREVTMYLLAQTSTKWRGPRLDTRVRIHECS